MAASAAGILDPAIWLEESHKRALQFAYANPVAFAASQPVILSREYETNARKLGEAQISLAGYRLARVLNAAFE